MPDSFDHYAVCDRPSATVAPAPLTPEQLAELDWLATSPRAIAIVQNAVLAALLAAYRREARQHLDRAYRYLYHAEDMRIGPNLSDYLSRAADNLEAAGYPKLAADLREGESVRRVTDAVRELLNG